MEIETKIIEFRINGDRISECEITLIEFDDSDLVSIELVIDNQKFSHSNEDFFSALTDVRKNLETLNIQICCNGAARNVYPSNMQRSMGSGRVAYKLYSGERAKLEDVVDIFDCDDRLEFVTVDEQERFYKNWVSG
ncbi:hypothetical protein [Leptospira santarosai]|uniref:Uncharacterized protein n=1 Tax=Leptospira santarosai str. MOR084 TaxID=1049984 RepID=A0A0E2BD65_9LEPT|nr:hypothetical protein [Leptospira santarosai]EKO33163.1 hypothetical protein LEP1GSC179_4155 [Leptospira santarosai str. MOR084]EKR92910.1 hypothetical protein LEP1GSC163_2318 [Leptospira santarosai str. CBC379]EMJ50535.1 hypothetical protein LEP1GSC169_2516 [Leptospira santarosai str. HAI1349]EMO23039.1 hypothetical protein LEP1GSC168_0560 [Leptospira santarosai str. HAI134]MDI7182488.1 hypothetical protein [Leptospira santarosai]